MEANLAVANASQWVYIWHYGLKKPRRTFIQAAAGGLVMAGCKPNPIENVPDYKTGYFYDAACLDHISVEGVTVEIPARMTAIQQKLADTGLLAKLTAVTALPDPLPYIKMIHTDAHIEAISQIPNTGTVAPLAVAGVLGAVKAVSEGTVRNAFCAIRPPGHHANNSGAEEGFCYYNNVAIAARYAQNALGYAKILVIDWDYHHGNGIGELLA
jgi:acetoin utilization deacetylase AcuC-like enzyme